jgi:hypothetical protein
VRVLTSAAYMGTRMRARLRPGDEMQRPSGDTRSTPDYITYVNNALWTTSPTLQLPSTRSDVSPSSRNLSSPSEIISISSTTARSSAMSDSTSL